MQVITRQVSKFRRAALGCLSFRPETQPGMGGHCAARNRARYDRIARSHAAIRAFYAAHPEEAQRFREFQDQTRREDWRKTKEAWAKKPFPQYCAKVQKEWAAKKAQKAQKAQQKAKPPSESELRSELETELKQRDILQAELKSEKLKATFSNP